MLENDLALAARAEALAKSNDYRVLRRLIPRTTFTRSVGQSTKAGILFDVEVPLCLAMFKSERHSGSSVRSRRFTAAAYAVRLCCSLKNWRGERQSRRRI
jgi:hypothetical protein